MEKRHKILIFVASLLVSGGFWAVIFSWAAWKRMGGIWSRPKQVVMEEVVAYHRHSIVGPETDSLDHRDGACYLSCGL